MIKRIVFTCLLLASLSAWLAPPAVAQQQPQPPEQQNEFVPVDELPQGEQLPAAPLLIIAYAVAWLALFVYMLSIWRRLQKVERELGDVSRRIGERSRT
jgi:CcmD family protein